MNRLKFHNALKVHSHCAFFSDFITILLVATNGLYTRMYSSHLTLGRVLFFHIHGCTGPNGSVLPVHCQSLEIASVSVADPGFPRRGGANPKVWDANLLFWSMFPKNCMKIKKKWIGGGGKYVLGAIPLDSPIGVYKLADHHHHIKGSTWFVRHAITK